MSRFLCTKHHEWILANDDGSAVIGITDHAQSELGDIVYVELPDIGDSFEAAEEFGSLESVKAVAEVYLPASGEITEVNELLEEHPDMVNKNPLESGWLIKINITNADALDGLMDEEAYKAFVASESK